MILTKYVRNPFSDEAYFDRDAFQEDVKVATRFLDDVLDTTFWPLESQKREAMNKRRIGLGFLGLGSALPMLGLRYDSECGRRFARHVAAWMMEAAYRASVEVAKEKGPFPLCDQRFLDSPMVQRLPEDLQEEIAAHGIRNSHLTSIAPTGTIALAFADNASNGIEPPFSWEYTRHKREDDGETRTFRVQDHAYRVYCSMFGETAPEDLPDTFRSALEMSALDHQRMVNAVAPYVDAAISKTVNVPADYDFQDFQALYLEAWKAGAKGCTTFRPNEVTGSVLSTDADGPEDFTDDPDRRVEVKQLPQPALSSLRWPSRPEMPQGNPAWTYTVEDPDARGKFAVFVGHVDNGTAKPFEVWINGAEQPRGIGALAKMLSADMRSEDSAWLGRKLQALKKTTSEQPIRLKMPPDGDEAVVPSAAAAVGHLVEHRCRELGAFEREGETPMLDALISRRGEPKTGPDGTMSWTVDVVNHATGDDFVLGLKELTLPDGQRRPYSMWLSGNYPRSLDGLCKVLSLDMQVLDPAWIGLKLRGLATYTEAQGETWQQVPGADRQTVYRSTEAYIAALVTHRHQMLGLLDEAGYPVHQMGLLDQPWAAENVVPLQKAAGQTHNAPIAGKQCDHCGVRAVIPRDGCEYCTACGHTGECG